MKKFILLLTLASLCLAACVPGEELPSTTAGVPSTQTEPTTEPIQTTQPIETTLPPETTIPPETTLPPEPPHSPLYQEGFEVDTIIRYFNEVCLDAEFVNSGDASRLQKWMNPIYYSLEGNPTEKDLEVLNRFTAWLNEVEGFPGIYESENPYLTNLRIYFCTYPELLDRMGYQFVGVDGAVTFWYSDDIIYNAVICYCTEVDQFTRNSVILEEIYNGLGPIQDTTLRTDSIIYSGYSQVQGLTVIDELILKLLYHPDMKCGMTAQECEAVIRQLYY